MKRFLLRFSRKYYSLKLSIAVMLLFLSLAAVIIFIYTNSRTVADVTISQPEHLPSISFDKGDFFISIDKISVNAPVVPDVDGADKEIYFASLQRGIAHMQGTSKPGEKGNIVLFGHSNFYETDPGLYKQVFKNLDKLETGDKINVRYKGEEYVYIVTRKEIVLPEGTWVISAPYNLTLITCWPPGTVEKRLIIFANLQP